MSNHEYWVIMQWIWHKLCNKLWNDNWCLQADWIHGHRVAAMPSLKSLCVCARLKLLIDWPHPGKAWRAQWMWRGTTWRSWTCCPTTWSSTCCRLPTAPAAWCLRRTRSSSSRPKTRGWVANTGRRQWPIQRKFSTSAEKTNVVLVSSSFRHSQCEFASCSMTSVSNKAGWVEDHCSSEWPTTPPGCFETSSKESLLFWIKYFKNIVNLFKMSRCLCLVFLTVELKITVL